MIKLADLVFVADKTVIKMGSGFKVFQLPTAIVYVSRKEVTDLLSEAYAARGLGPLKIADDAKSCELALAASPLATLILDTAHTESELAQILGAAQGRYRIDTRPIYMIAYEITAKELARALEYRVTQLHVGDLTLPTIERNLNELLQYGTRSEKQVEVFGLVIAARRAGNHNEALGHLVRLNEEEEGNVQTMSELATSLCDAGQWDDAKVLLLKTVSNFPFDPRAKHLLARAFMREGDYKKAQKYLEGATLLSPMNTERLCDLAEVFMNQLELDKALGKFGEALALDEDCKRARHGQIQCELLKEEAQEALRLMKQLEEPWEIASVFNGAAIVAIRTGHFKQGIRLYQTAVGQLNKHASLSSRVFFNMGLGLYKWGKDELALKAFERSLELDPAYEKASHNQKLLSQRLQSEAKAEAEIEAREDSRSESIPAIESETEDLAEQPIFAMAG